MYAEGERGYPFKVGRYTVDKMGQERWISGPDDFSAGPFNSDAACDSVILAEQDRAFMDDHVKFIPIKF